MKSHSIGAKQPPRAALALFVFAASGCSETTPPARARAGADDGPSALPVAGETRASAATVDTSRAAGRGEAGHDAPRCPVGMILVAGYASTPSFCVDRTAVTIGAFNTCGPCVASHGFVPGPPEATMTHAPPDEMAAYCRSRGVRLPSDDERARAEGPREGLHVATREEGFRCAAAPSP